jgi:hypothetical protein
VSRRAYGSGSLLVDTRADGTRVYVAKFRDASGRQLKVGSGGCAHRTGRTASPSRTPKRACATS